MSRVLIVTKNLESLWVSRQCLSNSTMDWGKVTSFILLVFPNWPSSTSQSWSGGWTRQWAHLQESQHSLFASVVSYYQTLKVLRVVNEVHPTPRWERLGLHIFSLSIIGWTLSNCLDLGFLMTQPESRVWPKQEYVVWSLQDLSKRFLISQIHD